MEKTISPDSAKAEIAFPKHLGIFMDFTVFVNGFAVRSNECGYCCEEVFGRIHGAGYRELPLMTPDFSESSAAELTD